MPWPHFEVPAGAVDGANLVFVVSQPYKPGSTAVFLNGLLQERSLEDGWVETDPALGIVTLKEPPRGNPSGYPDIIQIFYLDTSPVLPETEISSRLTGTIVASEEIAEAVILDSSLLEVELSSSAEVSGVVSSVGLLSAVVSETEELEGFLAECG